MLVNREYLKVLNAVVEFVSIPVMDLFIVCKRAPKVLRHDEAMLHDVPVFCRVWVVMSKDNHVPVVNVPPAFPAGGIFASHTLERV